MGKLLEWPGVITEGDDLEDCRILLREAAEEMADMYKEGGLKIHNRTLIVEPVDISMDAALIAHVV